MPFPHTVRCWAAGGYRGEVWNWGDAISPTIYSELTGKTPNVIDYTDMTEEPHIMICGSTLRWVTNSSIIWGIGEHWENKAFIDPAAIPLDVAAVRGPLTRRKLLNKGIPCPEIYGNPALLFPLFYNPEVRKHYEIGIIPHYFDYEDERLAKYRYRSEVKIIDITQRSSSNRIFDLVDEVRSCRRILSSSLHGIILADAYRIPSAWLQISDKVPGGDFKFKDYFLSSGRDIEKYGAVTEFSDLDKLFDIFDQQHIDDDILNTNTAALLSSFPGKVLEKYL